MSESPPALDDTPSRLPAWAPFLVIVVAWLAQGAVLSNEWVLDDAALVSENPEVLRGPKALRTIFAAGTLPGEMEPNAYRPLVLASFALESPLWKANDGTLEPFGFHLTNLLLHSLCAWLLMAVILRLAPGRPVVALGAALCFAVHPLHTGTVSLLAGRADLLALLFTLLAALGWRAFDGRNFAWLPLAALCWFLALLSKDAALGLPLALLLTDLAANRRPTSLPRLAGYGVMALSLVLFLTLWTGPVDAAADVPRQSIDARLLVGFAGLGRLLIRLAIPISFRGDHTDEIVPGEGYVVEGAAAVACALAIGITLVVMFLVASRRCRLPGLAWLLTLALAIPAILIQPIGAPLENRFAYVVLIPLFAVAGVLIEALWVRRVPVGSYATPGAVGVLVAVLALGVLSRREAQAWRSDDAFHEQLLERNPDHIGALLRLGRRLRKEAEAARLESISLPSMDAEGQPNPERERWVRLRRQKLERAHEVLRRANEHPAGKGRIETSIELGAVLLARGRAAEALLAYNEAKRLDPLLQQTTDDEGDVTKQYSLRKVRRAAEVYFSIGVCLEALGQRERKTEAFRMAARLQPRNSQYLTVAGYSLCELKRWSEGLPLIEEAIRHAPDAASRKKLIEEYEHQKIRSKEMGAELYRQGHQHLLDGNDRARELALEKFEMAYLADGDHVEARIEAAWILGQWFGRYGRAFKLLNEAEQILKKRGADADSPLMQKIAASRKALRKQKQEEDREN